MKHAKALKFYRGGLGFKTYCKDDDQQHAFNTGTKFELYPSHFLYAPARDNNENNPPGGSGFGSITLAYNVKNKEDAGSVIELVKRRAAPSSRSPKIRFGADTVRILPILTDTTGRRLGSLTLNLTRTDCSNFRANCVKALLF